MTDRFEAFNLRASIALYVNRKVSNIDWNKEVILDIPSLTILEWNIVEYEEPAIEHLQELWEAEKLNFYKGQQKAKIKAQFLYHLTKGPEGCTTSVIREDVPIVMDARRDGPFNDAENMEKLSWLMEQENISETNVRDFHNQYH